MNSAPAEPSPEHLAVLSIVIRDIARSRRMSREDKDDFAQSVHLKFIEREYDIFHRFDGRSSLRTYLFVVVRNMLLDWQNTTYGKWRPSAAAVRAGEQAIELERLIARDGHTADEAIALLRTRPEAPSECELWKLVDALPARRPGRRVTADVSAEVEPHVEFHDPVATRDRSRAEAAIRARLAAALAGLPTDDRRLIVLRYRHDRSVQSVAQMLETDPKALYRRFDRVLRSLRRHLTQQGVSSPSTEFI
jgi:RNA polymerase sigma factor (sigma-70 family)